MNIPTNKKAAANNRAFCLGCTALSGKMILVTKLTRSRSQPWSILPTIRRESPDIILKEKQPAVTGVRMDDWKIFLGVNNNLRKYYGFQKPGYIRTLNSESTKALLLITAGPSMTNNTSSLAFLTKNDGTIQVQSCWIRPM